MQLQQVNNIAKDIVTPMGVDPKLLTKLFAEQSQFIYKGDKGYETFDGPQPDMMDFRQMFEAAEKGGFGTPTGPSGLASVGVIPPVALSMAGALGLRSSSPLSLASSSSSTSTGHGTTTTTTTTTVVVTHGNGETETIVEGDHLPPGTNEMIMSAAAATFPMEGFPVNGSFQVQNPTIPPGASSVQVQAYHQALELGVGVSTSPVRDHPSSSGMTTTTMHTTTIINSSSNSHPVNDLKEFPPPLPVMIDSAASCAGLIYDSEAAAAAAAAAIAAAESAPRPAKSPKGSSKEKTAGMSSISSGPKDSPPPAPPTPATPVAPIAAAKVTTPPAPVPQPQPHPAAVPQAVVPQKKQLAKRTRPLSQQGGPMATCPGGQTPRQSNQHTQTNSNHGHAHVHSHGGRGAVHNHSVASTQTSEKLQKQQKEKNKLGIDLDSATESNGETSLSIAAASGHYEVVDFLIEQSAHIGKFC